METTSGGILTDPFGQPDAAAVAEAALARLREQRWRLGRVQTEVEEAERRLAGRPVGAGWRSPAQRAYEGRVAELTRGLHGAWRALDAALSAVDVEIDRVKAGR